MTADEITKVAKIALTADSWCPNCQAGLFEELRKAFPAHTDTIDQVWSDRERIERSYRDAVSKTWDNFEDDPPNVWEVA